MIRSGQPLPAGYAPASDVARSASESPSTQQRQHGPPFAVVRRCSPNLKRQAIRVEVVDTMIVSGLVQRVEYSTPANKEVVVHGDRWQFAVNRDHDRACEGDCVVVRV
jgi:hypothetical protein